MKVISTFIYSCVALLAGASSVSAATVPLSGTMQIEAVTRDVNGNFVSGSYFSMGGNDPNGAAAVSLHPTDSPDPGGIVLGTYQNFVLDPDVPHPYNWNGNGAAAGTGFNGTPTTAGTIVSPFKFFGVSTYVGTNPVSYQSGNSHTAPTAAVDLGNCVGDVCAMTIDLSSWEVMWNGSAFEQGPRPVSTGPFVLATGQYNIVNHDYSVEWSSQINGGPFNKTTGYWHLEGTVVPLPGAVWLFGSGLAGLLGFSRRSRA